MPERVYMNRIPGEERIHIEFRADEIAAVLEDLDESSLGRSPETEMLRQLLAEAQRQIGA
jgi:hypothetical protein